MASAPEVTVTCHVDEVYKGMLALMVDPPINGDEGQLPFGRAAWDLIDLLHAALAAGSKDRQLQRAASHLDRLWSTTRDVSELPASNVVTARKSCQSYVDELHELLTRVNKWRSKGYFKQALGSQKYRELFQDIFDNLHGTTSALASAAVHANPERANQVQAELGELLSEARKLTQAADQITNSLAEMRAVNAGQLPPAELLQLKNDLVREMDERQEATVESLQGAMSIGLKGIDAKCDARHDALAQQLQVFGEQVADLVREQRALGPAGASAAQVNATAQAAEEQARQAQAAALGKPPTALQGAPIPRLVLASPPPPPPPGSSAAPTAGGANGAEADVEKLWQGFLAPQLDELGNLVRALQRASPGDPLVVALEAWCLWHGLGLRKNKDTAMQCLERVDVPALQARAEHNPHAQVLLGEIVFAGKCGLAQDQPAAVQLFTLAADQGHTVAQNNLGFCYHSGKGVPAKNHGTAFDWWGRAADGGYAAGQFNLRKWLC